MRTAEDIVIIGASGAITMHKPFESIHIPADLVQDVLLAICGEHNDPTLRIMKLHTPDAETLAAYHASLASETPFSGTLDPVAE